MPAARMTRHLHPLSSTDHFVEPPHHVATDRLVVQMDNQRTNGRRPDLRGREREIRDAPVRATSP